MNRYVITGATSFIGRNIVKFLKEQNNEVFAIIRPTSSNLHLFNKDINVIVSDSGDVECWVDKIKTADYFIHLSWDGIGVNGRNNKDIQEKNIIDSCACMDGAIKLGCKVFFFAGSQAEYGVCSDMIMENQVCNPITYYGKAKLDVFKKLFIKAKENNITYYHGRIFSVYGFGDHPWTLVSDCIKKFKNNEEKHLSSCSQYWNFLYIDDAVKQIVKLINSNVDSGIYNIASKDTRPLKEFVNDIFNVCENKGLMVFDSYSPKEKSPNLIPNIDKISNVIGEDYEYVGFAEGIKNIIKQGENE